MSLDPAAAAATLAQARATRVPLPPFTATDPTLDARWAYDVQDCDRAARLASGESAVGAKLGLTSPAKQARMGVDEPVVGFLTDALRLDPGVVAGALAGWIQPRIEPEIAFVLGRPVSSRLTLAEARAAVASVGIAAEIIDSRYEDYRFRLADVVADNTSAAGVVLGDLHPGADVPELATLRCTLSVDGEVRHEATGAAILGDPYAALVHLSGHLAARGDALPAGSLVLAGALTDAEPLLAGSSYRLTIASLGTIDVSV
ncbi:2-keto-4-pentenoate hydratase [Nocardioides daeguensis]|uniref:Fumarylacetoacetate hydrolase family protein n=1 Tax=Nocardioides daeguensis TaxID=908359 RepID=A0ABP6VSZ6_9ACTN|nr:fumarylacetoacetate hydrolase family protein [Nocardioides daeguensis]MBV6727583.1 fumarylacetoacetate hydrolase family protein [Nocardioides daeguensis]MCR1773195.1 fumarylacetoacetate hydrolase family protein [Nocardioides daeguensis]